MKVVSGKEFAKVLERHGWSLFRIQGSTIFMENRAAMCGSPSLFMGIERSRLGCSDTDENGWADRRRPITLRRI